MNTMAHEITFANLMAHRYVAGSHCSTCGAEVYGLHSWDCPEAADGRNPYLYRRRLYLPEPEPVRRLRWWERIARLVEP